MKKNKELTAFFQNMFLILALCTFCIFTTLIPTMIHYEDKLAEQKSKEDIKFKRIKKSSYNKLEVINLKLNETNILLEQLKLNEKTVSDLLKQSQKKRKFINEKLEEVLFEIDYLIYKTLI